MTHQENPRETMLDPGAFYSHVQQELSRNSGEGFSLVTLILEALDESNQSLSSACLPLLPPVFRLAWARKSFFVP